MIKRSHELAGDLHPYPQVKAPFGYDAHGRTGRFIGPVTGRYPLYISNTSRPVLRPAR
jgi:hypothetical protein